MPTLYSFTWNVEQRGCALVPAISGEHGDFGVRRGLELRVGLDRRRPWRR